MIHIFIINHFAGSKDLAKNLRNHLAKKNGLRYFIFNTVRAGFETEIVKKIERYFEDEKLRFYCCGGSGTMRNMLNGVEKLADVEFAFLPCGLSNDFLKSFENEELFTNIDNLIEGKTIKIDYIKTNYGIGLNTVSVGFDSDVERLMRNYRIYEIFWGQLPYVLSTVNGILFSKRRQVELKIDGKEMGNNFNEIIFGNGCVLGGNLFFSEKNNITDGYASYLAAPDLHGFSAVYMILKIMKKQLHKLNERIKYGACKMIEVKSADGKPLNINFDGEIVLGGEYCKVEIVRKGLNFVIPQEVEVKEFVLHKEVE